MKKCFIFFMMSLLFTSGSVMAQKILLKIANITADEGEEIRAVDFKITSQTKWTPGGISVGKAKIDSFLIKKTNNTSTNDLYKSILTGKAYPEVIIEYSDADNNVYFIITLKTVFVSNFFWLSPECPTCLKLEHQVAFVPKQIETFDAATNETVRFDVTINNTY